MAQSNCRLGEDGPRDQDSAIYRRFLSCFNFCSEVGTMQGLVGFCYRLDLSVILGFGELG